METVSKVVNGEYRQNSPQVGRTLIGRARGADEGENLEKRSSVGYADQLQASGVV